MRITNIFVNRKVDESKRSVLDRINIPFGMLVSSAGLILAIVLALPTFSDWINSSRDKGYLGIWYTDYTDDFDNGMSCNHRGTTELFIEYKYAYSGAVTCVGTVNNKAFEASFNFRAGGIWSIEEDKLVFEIEDVNSSQVSSTLDGQKIPEISDQKVSDNITKHMPFYFEILEKENNEITTRKVAQNGTYTEVSFLRREIPFFPALN